MKQFWPMLMRAITMGEDLESELDWESNDEEIFNMIQSSTDTDNNSEKLSQAVSSWYGNDQTQWSKIALTRRKTKQENLKNVLPCWKGPARQNPPPTVLEVWKGPMTD